MNIEALLFDVDGTLADTERDGHRPAFNLAFKASGLDWEWSEDLYGKLLAVTGGKERIRYFIDQFLTESLKPKHTEALIADLHKAKTRFYTEMLAEGKIPLRPGVKRLLLEAKQAGLRLAVVTTTTPQNVTSLLENSLAPEGTTWFEVIAAGDIVPAKKPAPDIYAWALTQLKLSPKDCLAFEDSENGIKASVGAGVKTLVTVNGYTRSDNFAGALAVLSDLGEPDTPFTCHSGDVFGKKWVDLELLNQLHTMS